MKVLWWIVAVIVAGLAIVMLVAFVGRGSPLSRAEANYCADLADYGLAVANLRAIDQNSTVDDLQDSLRGIEQSWQNLRQSGQALREARLDVVEASFNNLGNTISGVSDNATLAEARAEIYRSALAGAAQVWEAQKLVCTYEIELQR